MPKGRSRKPTRPRIQRLLSIQSCRNVSSWKDVMAAAPNENIKIKCNDLFRASKWRICKIKTSHATPAQKREPFVLCKQSNDTNVYLYGSADNVRNDRSFLFIWHLNSENLLEYLNNYTTKTFKDEPKKHFEKAVDRSLDGGNMPMDALETMITKRHWKQRKELDILRLIRDVQQHLLQRKNKQLEVAGADDTASRIEELNQKIEFNFEHIMKTFVQTSIMVNLQYKQAYKTFGQRGSGRYCTHMSPDTFKDGLKEKFLKLGGRQTRFGEGKECFRIDDCTADVTAQLLCVDYANGQRLKRVDNTRKSWEYEPGKSRVTYSMHTLKLAVKYNVDVIKNGRKQIRR